MKHKIKQSLSQFNPKKLSLPDGWKHAGVLIPLILHHNRWYILFTKRTNTVRTHKGQISFPGGGMESIDNSLEETALRETEEELGIPPHKIEILGKIDDIKVYVSHYVITPFIGILDRDIKIEINPDEVASYFWIPLLDLCNPNIHYQKWRNYEGRRFIIHYYEWKDFLIWGITGNILTEFLEKISLDC